MSIEIYNDSKIYIIAPAKITTGGPELLHQMAFHLRKDLNLNAYIYYIPNNIKNPTPDPYKKYNVKFTNKIDDNENNILIVPETFPYITQIKNFKKIKKVIWWLSVNNLFISYLLYKNNFLFQRIINKLSAIFLKKEIFDIREMSLKYYNKYNFSINMPELKFVKEVDFHLVQSYYALNYLLQNGIPKEKIFYLSDYINEKFLINKFDINNKQNIVTYNPKKGKCFTQKIINYAPEIKFVPISNMSIDQVISILKKSKVYIDFGDHPGKDRLPREAAILGNCIITNKKGSAAYAEDVPIPEEYKIEDNEKNIPKIIDKIKECLNNYEYHINNFEEYRKKIKNEPKKFINDLKKIFKIKYKS